MSDDVGRVIEAVAAALAAEDGQWSIEEAEYEQYRALARVSASTVIRIMLQQVDIPDLAEDNIREWAARQGVEA